MLNSTLTQLDATMMMMVYALCFGTSFSFQCDVLFVIIISISAFLTFYRLNQNSMQRSVCDVNTLLYFHKRKLFFYYFCF